MLMFYLKGLLLQFYDKCQEKLMDSVPLFDYNSANLLLWRCYPRTTLTQDEYFWREGGGYKPINSKIKEMTQSLGLRRE